MASREYCATAPALSGGQFNEVIIEARGRETIKVGAKSFALNRFSVDGVVWGRETLWLDDDGSIAAGITRAGGLSFEAVRDDLEPALLDFVKSGTRDRLGDLEAIARKAPPVHSGAFAFSGGTIVDGTGRAPIPDATLVVRDGRIADVGPSRDVAIPPGVPVVRVDGKTLVPGLWDMHTHVTQIEWAPVYLAAGVTTVRDMGNEFEFITALKQSGAVGPRARPAPSARRVDRRRRAQRVRRL